MRGIYYKLPLDFDKLVSKKEADKVALDHSIRQHIFLLATTALGECKFDETYGSEVWEMDFDLMKSDNALKEMISETLKKSITKHEKRIFLNEVEVNVVDYNLGTLGKRRMKKKVTVSIRGTILETNGSLIFTNSFFVGPLSY